jgi:hypothetical protein
MMKRSVQMLIVCGCALIAAAITAVPAVAAVKPPRSAVTSVCTTSTKAVDRKITTEATMRPVPGTQAMWIKLLLQARPNLPGSAYANVTLPTDSDFGTWLKPDPLTLGQNPNDVWNLTKPENDLRPGYTFRVEVKFRWWGTGTKILKQQTRYTKGCKQPAAKPKKAH